MKEWWRIASVFVLITGCTVNADPAPSGDDFQDFCRFQEDESGQRVCLPDFNRAGSSAGGGSHSAGTAPVVVTGGTSAGGTTWEASGGATEAGGWTTAAGGVIVGGTGAPDPGGSTSIGGTGPYDPGGGTSVAGSTASGGALPSTPVNVCSDFLVPYDPSLTFAQHTEFEQSICASFGAIVALVISTPNGDVLTCCTISRDPPASGGAGGTGGVPLAGTTGVAVTGGSAPR